jgi:hypothetical protein
MKCPNCGHEINVGAIVGKLGKGHKKTTSPEMIAQRKAASALGVAARRKKALRAATESNT